MAGERRACVHIGMPKTATTSIQVAFFHTRALLESDAGILYPGKQPNHSQPLYSLFCDNPLDFMHYVRSGITDMDRIDAINANNKAALENQITASSAGTVFFSGETLSLLSDAGVSRFRQWLEGFFTDFRILMVLRHPVAWASSEAQKNILGGAGTMARILQRPPVPNFRKRLEKYCRAFGRDNVHLIDFDSARNSAGGITGVFADYFSVPPQVKVALASATQEQNPSMSHEATLLLSALNEAFPLRRKGSQEPGRFGDVEFLRRVKGPKFRLPDDALGRVSADSAPDLQWLKQEFGFAFASADDPHPSTDEPRLFSDDTLVSLVGSFWNEVAQARAECLFERAMRFESQGKGRQAEECLKECLKILPGHKGAERLLATMPSDRE